MKKKIQSQNLAEILSIRSDSSINKCEEFIQTWLDTITEEMTRNDEIKVQGLGTFKSVIVSERESIDVTTGERIVIPSFRKLTFSPDESVKRKANEFVAEHIDGENKVQTAQNVEESQEVETRNNTSTTEREDEAQENANETGIGKDSMQPAEGVIMAHDISILLERMKALSERKEKSKNEATYNEDDQTEEEYSALSAIISAPEILSNARLRLHAAKEKAAKARLELQAAESNLYQAEAKAKLAKENTEKAKETANDATTEANLFEEMIQNIEQFKMNAEMSGEDERDKGNLMQSVIAEASEQSIDLHTQLAAIFGSGTPMQKPAETHTEEQTKSLSENTAEKQSETDEKNVIEPEAAENSTVHTELSQEVPTEEHNDYAQQGIITKTYDIQTDTPDNSMEGDDQNVIIETEQNVEAQNTMISSQKDERKDVWGAEENNNDNTNTEEEIIENTETDSNEDELNSGVYENTYERDENLYSQSKHKHHHKHHQEKNQVSEATAVYANKKKICIIAASVAVVVLGLIALFMISSQSKKINTIDLTQEKTEQKVRTEKTENATNDTPKAMNPIKQQSTAANKNIGDKVENEPPKASQPIAHPQANKDKSAEINKNSNQVKVNDKLTPKHRTHIMTAGQSLTGISLMYYNTKDSVKSIAKTNHINDINNVPVGTKLILP